MRTVYGQRVLGCRTQGARAGFFLLVILGKQWYQAGMSGSKPHAQLVTTQTF